MQERESAPHILIVMPRFHPLFGGHINHLKNLLPRIMRQGHRFTALTGSVQGQPGRDEVAGIAIRRLPVFGPERVVQGVLFALVSAVYLIVHRREYDLVHVLGAGWHAQTTVLVARALRKPALVEMTLLGVSDPESIRGRPLGALRLALWKRFDRVVSISTALSESCRRVELDPKKLVEIRIGIDTRAFAPPESAEAKRELRRELELPDDALLVLFVGAFIERKGVDVLIEAFRSVVKDHPAAQLVLVGPERDTEHDRRFVAAQKRKIAEGGLDGNVIHVGWARSVADYLRACDAYVLPSTNEGLPSSVLEAMACGLPSVMSEIPGISSDVIRSDVEGLVVSDRTPGGYARALSRLLSSELLRREMGDAGRRRVCEAFDIEGRAERFARLYESLSDR